MKLIHLSGLLIFWLYVYLSKRLIITENGIGYMGILNSVADFVYWEDIEFLHMERLKVVINTKYL